jgi:zinc transport system permease protein
MAVMASILGVVAVFGGIFGSIQLDTPSGPSIVVTSAALFVLLFPLSTIVRKKRWVGR